MAVRDDRSDVKQTTTGFRGPLMVQSLTSAKSKFLSLVKKVAKKVAKKKATKKKAVKKVATKTAAVSEDTFMIEGGGLTPDCNFEVEWSSYEENSIKNEEDLFKF